MRKSHHSPSQSTRRTHASLGPWNISSVSLVKRKIKIPEVDIFHVELGKIKPPTFNGEHRKGEEVEAWLLEMKKYF
jgi:hypothetical protein